MAAGDITWFRYKRHDGVEQRVSRLDMDLPGHHSHYSYLQEITPEMMTKHKLLDLAKEATADRGLNYGKPEDNFERIAARWRAHLKNRFDLDVAIDATSVALMCADIKLARIEYQPDHQDSWVDLAGYAACGAEIAIGTKETRRHGVYTYPNGAKWDSETNQTTYPDGKGHPGEPEWPDSVDDGA